MPERQVTFKPGLGIQQASDRAGQQRPSGRGVSRMIAHAIRHATGRAAAAAFFKELAGIFAAVADRFLHEHGNAGGDIAAGRVGMEPARIADDRKIDSGGNRLGIAGDHLRLCGRRKGSVACPDRRTTTGGRSAERAKFWQCRWPMEPNPTIAPRSSPMVFMFSNL